MFTPLHAIDPDSWLVLAAITLLLGLSTSLGTCLFAGQIKHNAAADDELKIVLLIFGICPNFLIGYNVRGRKGMIHVTPTT